MSKLKLTILTLLILALGIVAFSYLTLRQAQGDKNQNTNVIPVKTGIQNGEQNTNTSTSTEEIDTSNWKTYRNEEYGFEFRYPGEVEGKKFSVYSNESTKSLKDTIFGIAITPENLGYQDHMLIFNVVEKNSKSVADLLLL